MIIRGGKRSVLEGHIVLSPAVGWAHNAGRQQLRGPKPGARNSQKVGGLRSEPKEGENQGQEPEAQEGEAQGGRTEPKKLKLGLEPIS